MPEIIKIKYQNQFKNTEIAANGKWDVPISKSDRDTHRNFNDLTVINTSNSILEVTPTMDYEKSFFVPAKSVSSWSFKNDNMKYNNLLIEEKSGAIVAANVVQVIVMKKRYEVV